MAVDKFEYTIFVRFVLKQAHTHTHAHTSTFNESNQLLYLYDFGAAAQLPRHLVNFNQCVDYPWRFEMINDTITLLLANDLMANVVAFYVLLYLVSNPHVYEMLRHSRYIFYDFSFFVSLLNFSFCFMLVGNVGNVHYLSYVQVCQNKFSFSIRVFVFFAFHQFYIVYSLICLYKSSFLDWNISSGIDVMPPFQRMVPIQSGNTMKSMHVHMKIFYNANAVACLLSMYRINIISLCHWKL